ncbi:hypothetical protein WR25_06437 [Diploscapter pachys]|uniref:UDENN domain-containing protein n=1 Tax=Diploscapter pachys TaxID=2018661 RepID=A0A2A2K925_9BILA|nr:hypothetical protein WR25_06437 [Diploscapter pachys]
MTPAQRLIHDNCAAAVGFDPRYLYGFVHFRQQKDPNLPRGYYQKSIVLVTICPFLNLFYSVTERIARLFFESGEPAIEAACHDIDMWPRPQVGVNLILPFMGCLIQCRIPTVCDLPFDSRIPTPKHDNSHSETLALSSIHQMDMYKSLSTVLSHVQLLWELVLIGEPLLVIASTPSRSSAIVQSLIQLISPLRYMHDFRPFFTIHDSEFKEYSTKSKSAPRIVLGVTNPFFIKTMDHYPNILKVADSNSENENPHDKQEKTRKHWDGRTLDTKPGLYTQYKPFLNRDKSIAKKLLKADRPDEVQNNVLQRHFLELTQSFMIPLERYLSSLMPLRKEMSPFKAVPHSRPFSMDDFLSSIDTSGPSLTCGVKGDWAGLYKKFFQSANFMGWLSTRSNDVKTQLKVHYIETLCMADFGKPVLATKHHVEIVDLVLRIRERIVELGNDNDKRQRLVNGTDENLGEHHRSDVVCGRDQTHFAVGAALDGLQLPSLQAGAFDASHVTGRLLTNWKRGSILDEDDEDEVEGVMEAGVEHREHCEHDHVATRRHCAEHAHQQHRGHQSVWKKGFQNPLFSILPADVILGLPMPGRSSSMLTLQVQTCISSSHIVTTNVTENSTHFTELDEAAIEQTSTLWNKKKIIKLTISWK